MHRPRTLSRLFSKLQGMNLLCLITSDIAWARWDHQRADQLGRFDKLGPEYFNDALSYRAPWRWDLDTEKSLVKLRIGAGSLNQKDFLYDQFLRVATPNTGEWQLFFAARRMDDKREDFEDDVLELSFQPEARAWSIGLMAEGFGDKAYTDLGLDLRWQYANWPSIRLDFWWIDGFYSQKKAEREDKRIDTPWSFGITLDHQIGNLKLSASHIDDQAVKWELVSRDQFYHFQRQSSYFEMTLQENFKSYYLDWQHDWLREGLGPLNSAITPGYNHREDRVELGLKEQHGRASSQIALWGVGSDTSYQGASRESESLFPLLSPGLESIKRREFAMFTTWYQPLDEDSIHAQQWGLFANRVMNDELLYETYNEVKIQWALDWAISKQGRFLLGTTWDLDEIFEGFIKKGERLQPWGGGYTQISIHF